MCRENMKNDSLNFGWAIENMALGGWSILYDQNDYWLSDDTFFHSKFFILHFYSYISVTAL